MKKYIKSHEHISKHQHITRALLKRIRQVRNIIDFLIIIIGLYVSGDNTFSVS
uniref:Uncharacterized protein n=1 Tax=Arion vulgaris TaxID=1028688 RepID=A0A0B6YC04_9EUPU